MVFRPTDDVVEPAERRDLLDILRERDAAQESEATDEAQVGDDQTGEPSADDG